MKLLASNLALSVQTFSYLSTSTALSSPFLVALSPPSPEVRRLLRPWPANKLSLTALRHVCQQGYSGCAGNFSDDATCKTALFRFGQPVRQLPRPWESWQGFVHTSGFTLLAVSLTLSVTGLRCTSPPVSPIVPAPVACKSGALNVDSCPFLALARSSRLALACIWMESRAACLPPPGFVICSFLCLVLLLGLSFVEARRQRLLLSPLPPVTMSPRPLHSSHNAVHAIPSDPETRRKIGNNLEPSDWSEREESWRLEYNQKTTPKESSVMQIDCGRGRCLFLFGSCP